MNLERIGITFFQKKIIRNLMISFAASCSCEHNLITHSWHVRSKTVFMNGNFLQRFNADPHKIDFCWLFVIFHSSCFSKTFGLPKGFVLKHATDKHSLVSQVRRLPKMLILMETTFRSTIYTVKLASLQLPSLYTCMAQAYSLICLIEKKIIFGD